MEKLKMCSVDNVDKNIEKIGRLFPNCLTEKINESGEVELVIDFDRLKQELSKEIVEGNEERYQFTWPDKRKAELLANSPISKTLRPSREESIDFDNTENLYIEGDNLEALKLLQETYLGKVKMIYIDPPYNTGNDFIYNDKFSKLEEEYKEISGDYDEEGNRLVQNLETNGRFHTDWLNMIYPRLKVAQNLLSDDGVIFISIDDNELYNLKKICDDLFNEKNFISCLTIETGEVFGQKAAHVYKTMVKVKDYVLIYSKNRLNLNQRKPLYDKMNQLFDTHYRTVITEDMQTISLLEYLKSIDWISNLFSNYNLKISLANINLLMNLDSKFKDYINLDLSKIIYADQPFTGKISIEISNCIDKNGLAKYGKNILFKTKTGTIRYYQPFHNCLNQTDDYISEFTRSSFRGDLWKGFHYDMRNIDNEGKLKFKNAKKPVRLISQLIKWLNISEQENNIVMDFFSGSATTAHAVMQQNSEDNGNRKFIMVQLPEEIKDETINSRYKTICDIGKKRIIEAGKELKEKYPNLDTGFRVLKVDSSNMEDVYYQPKDVVKSLLDMMSDNIKSDRTSEDLLFQVMLDLGVPLSSRIEKIMIDEKEIFIVENGYLIACFDKNITEEIIKEIALKKPYYFIMRDSSMANDNVATNFEQIFATYSPDTIKKVL